MYRILWVSTTSLHDALSGSSQQWHDMLSSLKHWQAGQLAVHALCACAPHQPAGAVYRLPSAPALCNPPSAAWQFQEEGIDYTYAALASAAPAALTAQEQDRIFALYQGLIRSVRPDLLLSRGCGMLDLAVRSDAYFRGIPVAGCLDEAPQTAAAYRPCTLLLAASQAACDLCRTRLGLNVIPTGAFITARPPSGASQRRSYITIINPSPRKGLAIVAALAQLAAAALPEVKFLVIDGHGTFAADLARLYSIGPGGARLHPLRAELLPNVEIRPYTPQMSAVYAVSKLLLCPALDLGCGSRSACEALLHGVPCLISSCGVLPDAAASGTGAAFCLAVPPSCQRDSLCLPEASLIQPWLTQLQHMLQGSYAAACTAAARQLEPRRAAQRVWEVLEPLLSLKAGDGAQLLRGVSPPPAFN